MADPHNRASIIQFGLALSQPIPAGQNVGGQFGQAIGQAGEAAQRVTEEQHRQTAEEQRQQEITSKEDLRRAQSELASERASHVGDIAALRESGVQARRDIATLQANVRLRGLYDAYVKANAAQNQKNDLFGVPQVPTLEFDEWLARNPNLPALAGTGAPGNTMVDNTTGLRRTPVQTPDDVRKLPSGTPYITPDGRTGTAP